MALTYSKLFEPNMVDNAAPETLYTVPATPASGLLRQGRVRFANVTAGAVTIKAWAIPLAGSASDTNICLPTLSLAANSYVDLDIPTLKAGDFLQAQAGAGASITSMLIDGFVQS